MMCPEAVSQLLKVIMAEGPGTASQCWTRNIICLFWDP